MIIITLIGCLLAWGLYNLILNKVAQTIYPTRESDPFGRRLRYRLVFSVVPLGIAVVLLVLLKSA